MQFEVGENKYEVAKIGARNQFHIVRRLVPIISDLVPLLKKGGKDVDIDAIVPLVDALGKMSDADADYCLFGLLSAVRRDMGKGLGWAPVCNDTQLMYDDIDMGAMLQLAWQAFTFNMSTFFAALPSGLKEQLQTPADQ